jgi:hypothetical protein
MEWERKLRHCPFVVDLGDPPLDCKAVQAWLLEHCAPDCRVEVDSGWWGAGWSHKAVQAVRKFGSLTYTK